jgi:hypothetical protein
MVAGVDEERAGEGEVLTAGEGEALTVGEGEALTVGGGEVVVACVISPYFKYSALTTFLS